MLTKYFQEVPIDQNKKIVFERNEELYVLFEKTKTKTFKKFEGKSQVISNRNVKFGNTYYANTFLL